MSNPSLSSTDPMHGSFALAAMPDDKTNVTYWRGWPKEAWWTAPLLYWDEFSKHGQLGTEPNPRNAVGALCQQTTIPSGQSGPSRSCWPGTFPIARLTGADGRRLREKETRLSAIITPPASRMHGKLRNIPRSICRSWNRALALLPMLSERAQCPML